MPAYDYKTLARLDLTAAGTPQAVSATSIKAVTIIFTGEAGNTGNVSVFETGRAREDGVILAPGESYRVEAPQDSQDLNTIDVNEFSWDGDTNGNDLAVSYIAAE